MNAKRKTVLKGFDYMHCDDFAKYLSDMEAKGWHFKEWGAGLRFEKGEPKNATYAVEVFTNASENDMRPEPNTQEFAEYCEAAGWKFIDGKQKFCIFKKMDENAVELFSTEERVANAFKGMMSGQAMLSLALFGVNAVLQWINLNISFERNIFSGTFLFTFLVWNVAFVGQLCTLICAFWKKKKLEKEIKAGEKIYIGNCRDGKYHFNRREVYATFPILLLMYYFFSINRIDLVLVNAFAMGITVGFGVLMNKLRPDRDTSVMIQMGFSIVFIIALLVFSVIIIADDDDNVSLKQENLPLLVTDYREWSDEIEEVDFYHDRNFLGSFDTYFIWGEEEAVYYTLYQSKNAKILDRIWEEEVTGKKVNEDVEDCTADWGAKQAIRNKIGTYNVRYEDVVLIFSDDEDVYLTTEQIAVILEKLDVR